MVGRRIFVYIMFFCIIGIYGFQVDLYSKTRKEQKQIDRIESVGNEDKLQNVRKSLRTLKEYCPEFSYLNKKKIKSYLEMYEGSFGGYDNDFMFSDPMLKIKLVKKINSWLGTPYKWAGSSKKGIDCSNFTSRIINELLGLRIPAGAESQSKLFKPIRRIEDLRFGDLMFFIDATRRKKSDRVGHAGIYIGNGVFAHSSSYLKRGVVYSHINEGSFLKSFRFGGRLYKNDISQLSASNRNSL